MTDGWEGAAPSSSPRSDPAYRTGTSRLMTGSPQGRPKSCAVSERRSSHRWRSSSLIPRRRPSETARRSRKREGASA